MLFRGISPSAFGRAAYVLVILSFVTIPIHFLAERRSPWHGFFFAASGCVFVSALLVAILVKPRDVRLPVFALLGGSYWQRASVDAVGVVAALFGLIAYARRPYAR